MTILQSYTLHLVFKVCLRLKTNEFVQQITILTITRSIIIAVIFSWITPHPMLQPLQTRTCLKDRNLMVMPIKVRAIPMCASGDIYVWNSSRTLNLVMWHSRVPSLKANFGSCDWISMILGLLESPKWGEYYHPKTACFWWLLPELCAFGCYKSSVISIFASADVRTNTTNYFVLQ